MIEKYFDGVVPEPLDPQPLDQEFVASVSALPSQYQIHMDQLEINAALDGIWAVISKANKYIDDTAPWVLAKDPAQRNRLGTVLYNLAECSSTLFC